jgi:hypothetical protein
MNSSLGQQRCRVDKPHGEKASEMSDLPTVTDSAPEAIGDPVRQTQSDAPSDEVSSPELLITEQEVVFGTAAAATPNSAGKGANSRSSTSAASTARTSTASRSIRLS